MSVGSAILERPGAAHLDSKHLARQVFNKVKGSASDLRLSDNVGNPPIPGTGPISFDAVERVYRDVSKYLRTVNLLIPVGAEYSNDRPATDMRGNRWLVLSASQRGLEVKAFLDRVYQFEQRAETTAGIDYIFSSLNEMLATGDAEMCDSILASVDINRLKTDLLLSFLTITFAGRERLPSRRRYYAKARRQIARDVGWCEARRLLSALD